MPTPPDFVPGFSYSGYQAINPTRPLPGPRVDDDFANVATSINYTIDALGDVRRSDGALRNGIVTQESLAPGVAVQSTVQPTSADNGSFASGTLISEVGGLVFPAFMQTLLVRTYQDAAGQREAIELVRVTGIPSPVKAGHIVDGEGGYWRINAKAAKPTFFADMNGSAAGYRVALQKALDMNAAFPGMTGGHVEYCDGVFDMADVTLTISAKTILTASPGGCILQRSIDVGAAAYDIVRPPVFSATAVNHIRISGIQVDFTAAGTTVPATNSSFFSPFFFNGCNDVRLTDCVVNGAFYMGGVFNACTEIKAKGNKINGVVDRAFYVSTSTDDCEIENNLINGYRIGSTTRYTFYGVNFLHVGAAGFTNVRVSRNTIKHMAAHCIGFSGRISGSTCAENTIDDCTAHGILAQDIATINPSDLSIVGNQVSGCLGVGIYILNSFYVNVAGNGAHGCADAFVLQGGGKHNLGHNIAHDNTGYGYKMAALTANNSVNSNTSSACLVGVGEIGGALGNVVHDHTSITDTTAYGAAGVGSSYVDNLTF